MIQEMIINQVMSITTHHHCGKSLDWIAGVVGEVENARSLRHHHQDNEIIKDGIDMMMNMEIRIIVVDGQIVGIIMIVVILLHNRNELGINDIAKIILNTAFG